MKKLQPNKKKKSGFGKQKNTDNDLNWRNQDDIIAEESNVANSYVSKNTTDNDEDLDDLEKMDLGVGDNYYNQIIADDDDNV